VKNGKGKKVWKFRGIFFLAEIAKKFKNTVDKIEIKEQNNFW
jgi:hypothetical protein